MIDNRIENTIRRELFEWLAVNPAVDGSQRAGTDDVVISTVKNRRDENQDRAFYARFTSQDVRRSFSLIAVLDGIGGMVDGAECAEVSIVSILSSLVSHRCRGHNISLSDVLTIANRDVRRKYGGHGGTTFAGVFFERHSARAVNLGDSRIYQYSPPLGLERLSSDDRLGEQFAKVKGLETIKLNPELEGRLGQYLGMSDEVRPSVRYIGDSFFRTPDAYLLVSTDGAHSSGDELISRAIQENSQPLGIAESIIKMTLKTSDSDNATLICAKAAHFHLSNAEYRSQVDHLRLWSNRGVFNCLFVNNPAGPVRYGRNPKFAGTKESYSERSRNKSRTKQKEVQTPVLDNAGPNKPSKLNVTIEQLTFETPKTDESAN